MYTDLYLGEGKDNPPFTVRMAELESAQKRLSGNLNKLSFGTVTMLLTVVGEIVIKIFFK